jgi:hypothetical protein
VPKFFDNPAQRTAPLIALASSVSMINERQAGRKKPGSISPAFQTKLIPITG